MSKRSVLAILLSICLILTGFPSLGAVTARADKPEESADGQAFESEMKDLDPATLGVHKLGEITEDKEPDLSGLTPDTSLNQLVRVSIFFEENAAISAGYSAQGIGRNSSAQAYRASLRRNQAAMQAKIEEKVGYSINVKWNLTLLTNAISAYVYKKDIQEIKRIDGVADVQIENQYKVTDTAKPNTSNTSKYMVGAVDAWAAGYTGAGSRIAIIDTGIDTTHQSFDEDAFLHSVEEWEEENDTEVELLTEEDVNSLPEGALNVDGVYVSAKIPFGYNYVDENTTIDHLKDTEGEHGSHVAGIAAANKYIKKDGGYDLAAEAAFAVGMAPDAQLLVMKVFGANGGAYDSDYMVAIEDAIVLEADSCNLSLGSSMQGWTYDNNYQDLLNDLSDGTKNFGTLVSISAGNNSSMADNLGMDLYVEDVSEHTGGSPGTFLNSLDVASADNTGETGAPLVFFDKNVYFTESTSGEGVDYTNAPIKTIEGTHDFVYIDGKGTPEEYEAVNSAEALSGKVVIVNRGELTFSEKGNNAAAYGPKAVLIANNQAGSITMNLSDYTGTFPMVSIRLADADFIKEKAEEKTAGEVAYYTGSVTVTVDIMAENISAREDAQASSFSSWGIPGSLIMKPEITAPGGNIYSVFGTNLTKYGNTTGGSDQYELMSGTSMAAPHIAGMAAALSQYLKTCGYESLNGGLAEAYSRRAIMQSLLMSTATPMNGEGSYESILHQGAGLADVNAALNAKSVIMMEDAGLTTETGAAADGKVKAEFGDDPERKGEYSYSFRIYNISDTDLSFDLSTDMFTQDAYQIEEGGDVYLDTWTTDIDADVSYSYDPEVPSPYDVNKDGITSEADAQAILDYLSGENDGTALDLEVADLNKDGKVTTYDAHMLLAYEPETQEGLFVKAGKSKKVTVTITLPDSVKADLDETHPAGDYIEGYTFVKCTTSDAEGVSYEHTHSIPMLGYYGSWTDPSMFDNNSLTDSVYGSQKEPYSGNVHTNYFLMQYSGNKTEFYGNPYIVEEEFPTDKLAVNSSKVNFARVYYNLLRSAATTGFAISKIDAIGGDVTEVLDSAIDNYGVTGLWYDEENTVWENTGTKYYLINKKAADYELKEGDTFRVGYYAVPEYYGMLYNGDMRDRYSGYLVEDEDFASVIETNMLGDGAFVGFDFTVDDTTPEILSYSLSEDNKISISASDNMNLAYVAVLSLDGETVYAETAPGSDTCEFTTDDLSDAVENAEGYVAVFAADYAGNEVAKALKVNDKEAADPAKVAEIKVEPETLDLYVGNNTDLNVSVIPVTAEDRSIIWTSSDENVAAIDENGHLVAAGAGTATITATAAADESVFGTCEVEVISVDKAFDAIVWDENGEVYFSTFNTNSLPAYTKNSENAVTYLHSGFVKDDEDGNYLYAATLDTSAVSSDVYRIDPSTYELNAVGPNYVWATDMAVGASYYSDYVGYVYTFGSYILAGSMEPADDGSGVKYCGVPYALMNCSETTGGAYFAGVACKSRSPYGGEYYLLDENGVIWETTLDLTADYSGFEFSELTQVLDTDIATEFIYQSLYYDGKYIYWSHEGDNVATLYLIDPEEKIVYDAGNFGDGVWPVTAMHVKDTVAPASQSGSETMEIPADIAPLEIGRDEIMSAEILARYAEHAAKGKAGSAAGGGLNAIRGNAPKAKKASPAKNPVRSTGETSEDGIITVTLSEHEDVTNGLIRTKYDPSKLSFVEADTDLTYTSCHADTEAGVITFAYADKEAIAADTALGVLKFKAVEGAETDDASTAVTVDVIELNAVAAENDPIEETVIAITGPAFKTQSLVLSGQIGVNFYLDLPAVTGVDYTDKDSCYMEFQVGGRGGFTAKDYYDPSEMNPAGTYYQFTCYVNSIQMAQPVTAVFHYGSGKSITKTYTVEDYIKAVEANQSISDTDKVKVLTRALADYGYYAQQFLSAYRSWTIGTDYAAMNTHFTADGYADQYDEILEAVSGKRMTKDLGASDIAKISYTLNLDSNTEILLYLTVREGYEGTVTAKAGDQDLECTLLPDGRYKVVISGISAHKIGDDYHVVMTTESGEATADVSALSYVYAVLAKGINTAQKDVVSALYRYYEAAAAYKN